MLTSLLSLPNFAPVNVTERARLAADAAAGQATLLLENAGGIAAGAMLAIEAGGETGEIGRVLAVAVQGVTLAANLNSRHRQYASVARLAGDSLMLCGVQQRRLRAGRFRLRPLHLFQPLLPHPDPG